MNMKKMKKRNIVEGEKEMKIGKLKKVKKIQDVKEKEIKEKKKSKQKRRNRMKYMKEIKKEKKIQINIELVKENMILIYMMKMVKKEKI